MSDENGCARCGATDREIRPVGDDDPDEVCEPCWRALTNPPSPPPPPFRIELHAAVMAALGLDDGRCASCKAERDADHVRRAEVVCTACAEAHDAEVEADTRAALAEDAFTRERETDSNG